MIKLDGNSNGSMDAIMSNEVRLADDPNMKNDYGLLADSNAPNAQSQGIMGI